MQLTPKITAKSASIALDRTHRRPLTDVMILSVAQGTLQAAFRGGNSDDKGHTPTREAADTYPRPPSRRMTRASPPSLLLPTIKSLPTRLPLPSLPRPPRRHSSSPGSLSLSNPASDTTLYKSQFPDLSPVHSGKVREMYDLGDSMLMVTSDRLSAFDVVFPNPIPGKGRVLTALSVYWFGVLSDLVPNHLLEVPDAAWLSKITSEPDRYAGRCLVVRKAKPLKVECIVRGYLEGSAWKEYQERGAICEHTLPPGLKLHDPLPEPIFTPSTKAETGHDENITFEEAKSILGDSMADHVRDWSLTIYRFAHDKLKKAGITLADTKFEFGEHGDGLLLIDEVLTPDSSRFLIPDAAGNPVAMDKQFVRDWLLKTDWDKKPPAPELPPDVVNQTSERYREIARRILGKEV